MYTPGFDEENKTKPEIAKKIEGTDEGMTADQAARALFKGWYSNWEILATCLTMVRRGERPCPYYRRPHYQPLRCVDTWRHASA
jgi:hypothetical protein